MSEHTPGPWRVIAGKDEIMSARDDGGPAFGRAPVPGRASGHPGMSLRDWFAASALAFCCENRGPHLGEHRVAETVSLAYAIADAMLAARKEPE